MPERPQDPASMFWLFVHVSASRRQHPVLSPQTRMETSQDLF